MDKLRSLRSSLDENLHQKNAFNDLLAKAEEKTKISRVNLVLGMIFLRQYSVVRFCRFPRPLFGLRIWDQSHRYSHWFHISRIQIVRIAYFLTFSCSIKALETFDKEDDTKWLTYWVVFATVSVIEAFTDIFFYWIPLYSLLKCCVFLFLMTPTKPNGSIMIYEKLIRPYILKHEKKLDQAFDAAADLAGDFANTGEYFYNQKFLTLSGCPR
ncbi:unnamed protein product [Echinostoma caproni]|uniref:Receptor expression-enhancing protein n=1 Tax=Echinostoma caproni TaxID=27848 RepID=A0A183B1I9_9TREM|nr:unnamed protein product [Echinostoma caproni]